MDTNRIIASSLLLTMFVLSGFQKIFTFEKTVDNVYNKINYVNVTLAHLGVIFVILLEIVAALIILYSISTNQYREYAKLCIWGLIIFTVIVTLIYHPPDLSSYYKSIPFWANMSLLGGLLLLESIV